jgi:hypothetical protein
VKILLGDFSGEAILKPTTGNKSLHKINNDNGVRVVNFATSKNLSVKSAMFPHHNSHKFTWTCPDGKTYQIIHIYQNVDWTGEGIQVYLMSNLSGGVDCDADHYLVVVNSERERVAASKQAMQVFDMERFNLNDERVFKTIRSKETRQTAMVSGSAYNKCRQSEQYKTSN